MPQAIWNGVVLAESPTTEQVEGNHYFPPASINRAYFQESSTQTTCPWKGTASYFDIVVQDKIIKDGAWYYPAPKDAAKNISGHLAFSRSIIVET